MSTSIECLPRPLWLNIWLLTLLQRLLHFRYASGEKPEQKEAPKAGDVTVAISGTSKNFQGASGSAGSQGQALQARTSAGIGSFVDNANKKFDQKSG